MSEGLRVLLVEDQADLRDLVAEVLEGFGMQVHSTDTAAAAWDVLQQGHEYDVLFSDVHMPGHLSGAELSARVTSTMPNVRVVLSSGHARYQLPQLPASVEFLQKPYRLNQLVSLLRG